MDTPSMQANGSSSRTAILTAAARAFGSREPDASVRNPDSLADRLIRPAELAQIAGHPIADAFNREFDDAISDPEVFGLTWLMLVRTRYIDEMLLRAVRDGVTQLVILGAGFDTRAHRFGGVLNGAAVYEIDHPATQAYKRRRVEEALGASASPVTYAAVDFTRETLTDALARAGLQASRPAYCVCEGVSMYVPEDAMKQTLRAIGDLAPGSAVMLEYLNRGGLDVLTKFPSGTVKAASDWGEPFVFGVPDGQDREFFRACGLELGDALKVGSPESVRRYAMHADGTHYGARLSKAFAERREAALAAMSEEDRRQVAQAAATSGYWLAELRVNDSR